MKNWKDWDYTILTHTANLHGGPEKYVKLLQKQASQEAIATTNKRWMKHTIPALLVLTPLAVKGIISISQEYLPKIKEYF